jgi:hypothetical protein
LSASVTDAPYIDVTRAKLQDDHFGIHGDDEIVFDDKGRLREPRRSLFLDFDPPASDGIIST